MKLDLYNWTEVKLGQKIHSDTGRVKVRTSNPANFYVTDMIEGIEILAGSGQSIDFKAGSAVNYIVDAPEGTRVFVYAPRKNFSEAVGEVYTNIGRMPNESGTLNEVKKALRRQRIDMRNERISWQRDIDEQDRKRVEREQAATAEREATAKAAKKKTEKEPLVPDPEKENAELEAKSSES